MLASIILGQEYVRMHNIDVYVAPLITASVVERGCSMDVAKEDGQRQFNLRAILMWTIHDYVRYLLVASYVHQGYKACAICGLDSILHHSQELNKVVYEGFHHRLLSNHPY